MGVEMLEKNGFFTFGNLVDPSESTGDANNEYANFLIPVLGLKYVRKKRSDKNRQAIQDKYANLDLSCGGIDANIAMVARDLERLKANKPKKQFLSKKNLLAWEAQVSETDIVLNELNSTKRSLVCGGSTQPKVVETVEVVQQMPSTSGGTATMLQPTTKTGAIKDLGSSAGFMPLGMGIPKGLSEDNMSAGADDVENSPAAKKKSMLWLYITLGVVALGGVVLLVRRN